MGLTGCADFLAAGFGVAVDRGYLGAKMVGDRYCAWFHWPVYVPSA